MAPRRERTSILNALVALCATPVLFTGCAASPGEVAAAEEGLTLGGIPTTGIPGLSLTPELPEGTVATLRGQAMIDNDYLICNSIQLHLARHARWTPIYRAAGARDADIVAYRSGLEGYMEHACARDLRSDEALAAQRRLRETQRALVDRAADTLGTDPVSADLFLEQAVLADLEELREECFDSPEAEASMLFARLPMTPIVPVIVPEVSMQQAAFGRCAPSTPGGGGGSGRSPFDTEDLRDCIAEFAPTDECDDPTAQGGGPRPPQPRAGSLSPPALYFDNCGADACGASRTRVYNGLVHEISGVRFADGSKYIWRNIRNEGSIGGGTLRSVDSWFVHPDGTVEHTFHADMWEDTVENLRQLREIIQTLGELKKLLPLPSPNSSELTPPPPPPDAAPAPPDMPQEEPEIAIAQCQPVNPGASRPVGFQRPAGINPLGRSGLGPGAIGGDDVIAFCLCRQGAGGQELANSMGYGCGNSDWADRLRCTAGNCPTCNFTSDAPSGSECVGMLRDDNGESALEALADSCESVLSCPPGELSFSRMDRGTLECGCRPPYSGGGSSGGRSRECAFVNCRGLEPGNPAYARCCGAPIPVPRPGFGGFR